MEKKITLEVTIQILRRRDIGYDDMRKTFRRRMMGRDG